LRTLDGMCATTCAGDRDRISGNAYVRIPASVPPPAGRN
jgi:hypothetical protein